MEKIMSLLKIFLFRLLPIRYHLRIRAFSLSPKRFYYRIFKKNSIFISKSEIFMASINADKTMEEVINIFHPHSILDIGCGIGIAVDYFYSRSINTIGIEGSSMLIKEAKNKEMIVLHNLEEELNLHRKFDLIWSYEFVEHIHPKYIENLIKTFSNHSDNIVMTAARPGQGGEGHFNEQPSKYWINQFSKYGYSCDYETTAKLKEIKEWFNENLLVFKRQSI